MDDIRLQLPETEFRLMMVELYDQLKGQDLYLQSGCAQLRASGQWLPSLRIPMGPFPAFNLVISDRPFDTETEAGAYMKDIVHSVWADEHADGRVETVPENLTINYDE